MNTSTNITVVLLCCVLFLADPFSILLLLMEKGSSDLEVSGCNIVVALWPQHHDISYGEGEL